MAGLPDRQRETLMLKVQQDLKYTEISEILGCPVGTAKANFHHAVQNLKRALNAGVSVTEAARPPVARRSRSAAAGSESASEDGA